MLPVINTVKRRKFQVSNGYLLHTELLAKVLHFIAQRPEVKRIKRAELMDETGLANRQIEALVSMGIALGLIRSGVQVLTPLGRLVVQHDLFLDRLGTLEFLHYRAAANPSNLFWYDAFHHAFSELDEWSPPSLQEWFRQRLAEDYSEHTIKKHLREEVTFLLDAYLKNKFSGLEILVEVGPGRIQRRRYLRPDPIIFAAMIHAYGEGQDERLFQVEGFPELPGSPARVLGLDTGACRQLVESLHERGLIRYETSLNLNQIRLLPDVTSLDLLDHYYTGEDTNHV